MPANRCRGRPMMLANMRENGVRLFVVVFPNDLAGRWVHKVDAPAHDAGDRLIGVLAIPRQFLGRPARQKNGPGKLVQTGAAKSRDEVRFADRDRAELRASQ